MPISDPGNAGTAGSRDDSPEAQQLPRPRRVDPEGRQRASSLAGGLITGVALVVGFLVAVGIPDPLALAMVAVLWLASMIMASSIVTYRFGPPPRRVKGDRKP